MFATEARGTIERCFPQFLPRSLRVAKCALKAADLLSCDTPIEFIGLADRFGDSGEPAQHCGIGAGHTAVAVRLALARKIPTQKIGAV
jgi:hypothetical protein